MAKSNNDCVTTRTATKRDKCGITMYEEQDGSLTFDFDCLPPSLNQMLRAHWSKRKYIKDYYALMFRNEYNKTGLTIADPVEVSVTWRVMRRMDDDNAKARFKLIGDAMKAAGIVSDDNPEVMHLNEPKQEIVKHRAEQGFVVEVREYLPFAEPVAADPLGVYEVIR